MPLGKILRTRWLSPGSGVTEPCSRLPLLLLIESLDEVFKAGSFLFYANQYQLDVCLTYRI